MRQPSGEEPRVHGHQCAARAGGRSSGPGGPDSPGRCPA
ncbi:hypothetical protein FM125_05355 [Micrococcus lylae]|uniref:Uncharacterized protein n=1 Tax=Micrococcus lylae TaxID=1273 RepID=A0A1R4IYQ0_9MICC|nr:hypothetical protein FM125_05355 [Micrococcus lylae]